MTPSSGHCPAGASRIWLSLLCVGCALFAAGCGAVALAVAPLAVSAIGAGALVGVKVATEASPEDLAVTGMDGSPIGYPITAVYEGLLRATEATGLTVITADPSAYFLRVSYPFSLADNNWGGEITIACVVDGDGTRVIFADNGRDAAGRVQKLESKLLDQTLKWLRQPSQGQ